MQPGRRGDLAEKMMQMRQKENRLDRGKITGHRSDGEWRFYFCWASDCKLSAA